MAPRYAGIFDYQRVRNTTNIFLNNIKIPARDPKQCGGSKRIMYYNVDDDDNVDEVCEVVVDDFVVVVDDDDGEDEDK